MLSQAGRSFIDRRQVLRSIGLGALDLRKENWKAMVRAWRRGMEGCIHGPHLSGTHVIPPDLTTSSKPNPPPTKPNQIKSNQVKREPGKPVLNLDFLLQTVVQQVIPLDWPK